MAIIVTAPEKIGFSKDSILWRFEDDRAGITPGINAQAYFSVGNPVQEGTTVIFRWGSNDLRFTARETVGEYGNEIPTFPEFSVEGHEAYIKALAVVFQGNFFLSRDFDIEAVGVELLGVTIWIVQFTAKQRGTAFNFADTTFAGGGISMVVEGKDDSVIANNSVFVEVWVEKADGSMFELKYGAAQLFDSKSIAEFDVASVLHTCLASEIPDMLLPIAERCTQSRRKYYLRYALFGGTPPSIGPIQETQEFVVLLGGFAQWEQGPKSVTDTFKISSTESKLIKLRGALRTVRTTEPVFVSWVNLGAAGRKIHASATVRFADGTELTTNTGVVTGVQEYDKLIFGVGFRQLGLDILHGQGRIVREYTVQLRDDLGPVSDAYRLVIDYSHREYVRYFAHVNSYGCIETLTTFGKGSSYWKVFKEQAQKVLPYQFPSTEAQFVEWNATYQDNQEVATGWMRKKDLILWLDLFIAPLKYRVINGRPYAIHVNSDTIQKGLDGDNQHALTFEYQFSRIFDSVNEELLEGEDQADIIPPNIVLAGTSSGSQNPGGGGSSSPSTGFPTKIYVDPYPIRGSLNPITSDGVVRALEEYQKKLPLGDPDQYVNGEHQLRSMRQAVVSNEADPTVPPYAKTLTSLTKILNDLQALPPESGLNVYRFGGQFAQWYIERMTHPAFDRVPPIVVERSVPFEKYLDLSLYKTSFHRNEDLTVEIVFNTDKLAGVAVTASGLQITLKGTLEDLVSARDNVLLIIRDPARNQTTVSLQIENIEEPEEPDNRPVCQKGPFHYDKFAIQVFDNSHFRAPFDAMGVNPILWVLALTQSAENPVRQGESPPYNNTAFIDVTMPNPVAGGKYWLGISGKLCKSPWAWREIIFPDTTVLNWSTDYPKFNSNESFDEFLAKVNPSGRYLTQLVNLSTNTIVHSQEYDYVADTTEIQIWNPGGYPDGVYRLIVGTLSKDFTIGTPPAPPEIFKLVNGWDGTTIADLTAGPYQGPLAANGFNGYFEDKDTGVSFRLYRWGLEKEITGSYVQVTSVGGSAVAATASTIVPPVRLISTPGVDSRSIQFQGLTLNRTGKYRFSVYLHSGTTQDTAVVKTYQQTFQFNELKITGGWGNSGVPNGRVIPVVGGVKFNGVNVINNNVWAEPWASYPPGVPRLEFSLDKVTWYPTAAFFDGFGGATESSLQLLNTPTYSAVDLFPPGSKKTIYIRDGANHALVSDGYVINQSAVIGGEMTPKSFAKGFWEHINLEKVVTPTGVVFNDLATVTPPSGYEFWYMINREIIKRSTPLTGYTYPKGKPYGVYKAQVQIGYTGTLWAWHGQEGSNESLAQGFSHNSSIAFDCGVQNKK